MVVESEDWMGRRTRLSVGRGDAGADGGQEGGGDVSVKRRMGWGRVGEVERRRGGGGGEKVSGKMGRAGSG